MGGQQGIVPKPVLVGFRPSPQSPTAQAAQAAAQRCIFPGCTKPVFVEPTGRVHNYCSRAHAQQDGALPTTGLRPSFQSPTAQATQRVAKTCMYRGCTKPVFVEQNGRVHDYCGRTHAQLAGAL
ncbi:MAG: hypothetical protein JXA94_02545 [Parachlamydiales bacterium]|nr:hypothetical protein [Parachlamydiales bacterium]